MTKKELIAAVATETGVSKASAESVINATFDAIKKVVRNNDKIQVTGFGTFSRGERAARQGINPSTKKPIQIAAKSVAKFKQSSEFSI